MFEFTKKFQQNCSELMLRIWLVSIKNIVFIFDMIFLNNAKLFEKIIIFDNKNLVFLIRLANICDVY